ncbi:MAG: TRAP transporter small permease [Spirochaetota bacterium]
MNRFATIIYKLDIIFISISGVVLIFMMIVTLSDVIMRAFGRPIVGTIEIITFSGAVVIGFAIPYSTWKRSHVFVDFLTEKLSPFSKKIVNFITKSAAILLFLFIAYNFIIYSLDLIKTGEVSPTFKIPFYPITFGLVVATLLESLTLFCDLFSSLKGDNK